MTEEKMKGKFNEAAGSAREKAGEWTHNEDTEAQGEEQKMKGKGQGAWGNAKSKGEDIGHDVKEKVSGD